MMNASSKLVLTRAARTRTARPGLRDYSRESFLLVNARSRNFLRSASAFYGRRNMRKPDREGGRLAFAGRAAGVETPSLTVGLLLRACSWNTRRRSGVESSVNILLTG